MNVIINNSASSIFSFIGPVDKLKSAIVFDPDFFGEEVNSIKFNSFAKNVTILRFSSINGNFSLEELLLISEENLADVQNFRYESLIIIDSQLKVMVHWDCGECAIVTFLNPEISDEQRDFIRSKNKLAREHISLFDKKDSLYGYRLKIFEQFVAD